MIESAGKKILSIFIVVISLIATSTISFASIPDELEEDAVSTETEDVSLTNEDSIANPEQPSVAETVEIQAASQEPLPVKSRFTVDNITYEVTESASSSDNGKVMVQSPTLIKGTAILVPEFTYQGYNYTVTRIQNFNYNADVIEIPHTIEALATDPFFGKVKAFKVDDNNPYFMSDDDGVIFNKDGTELVFYPSARSATSYDIPNTVTEVVKRALVFADNLKEIKIPDSYEFDYVQEDSDSIFSMPRNVTKIKFDSHPSLFSIDGMVYTTDGKYLVCVAPGLKGSVTLLSSTSSDSNFAAAFLGCNSITNVNVESGSQSLTSAGGVLLSENGTVLEFVPLGRTGTITLPNTIKTISSNYHIALPYANGVVFPETMTELGYRAIEGCDKLKTIRFLGATPPIFDLESLYYIYGYEPVTASITVYVPKGCVSAYQTAMKEAIDYANGGGSPYSVYKISVREYTTSTGGGSGGGSGGGGGGGGSAPTGDKYPTSSSLGSTNAAVTQKPVDKNTVVSQVQSAINTAKGSGSTTGTVKVTNASDVSLDTLQSMANAAQNAGGTVKLVADTTVNSSVQARITVDTSKSTKAIKLGAFTDSAKAKSIANRFKSFSNRIQVVQLDQTGDFGQTVRIAAKVSLDGMDKDALVFYTYDEAANKYKKIENPNYTVDANGYVHFDTYNAGAIIISSGALTK